MSKNSNFANKEVEFSILFSIFKYGTKVIDTIQNLIEGDDFAESWNRRIFFDLCEIYESEKIVPSLTGYYLLKKSTPGISNEDLLKIKIALDEIKVSKLAEIDIPVTCRKLREMFVKRKAAVLFDKQLGNMSETDQDTDEILVEIENSISALRRKYNQHQEDEVVSFKNDIEKFIDYTNDIRLHPEKLGLAITGLKNFDRFIPKIHGGALIIYMARTGVGKTMFLMNTARRNYHYQKLKVLIITIEMSAKEYALRMHSNVSEIDHDLFATGQISADQSLIETWKKRIKEFGDGQNDSDIMIYGVPENCTVLKVATIIKNNPFKPDVVIMDYAGDMKAGLKGVPDYDPKAQAFIYSGLREIARRFNVVLFTAQQVTRSNKGKEITTESGAWSDVASSKATMMISIQETQDDRLHEDTRDGKRLDRLTVTMVKSRISNLLRTFILKRYEKMSFLEDEFEKPYIVKGTKDDETAKENEKRAESDNDELVPDEALNASMVPSEASEDILLPDV